jgi:hypothetical protein
VTRIRRTRHHAAWLLTAALLLFACGLAQPTSVTLAELVERAEELDGDDVELRGVVREFTVDEAARHHAVVEDAQHNRVELLPLDAALPYVDEPVRVVGRFRFDPEAGRALEVDTIERDREVGHGPPAG